MTPKSNKKNKKFAKPFVSSFLTKKQDAYKVLIFYKRFTLWTYTYRYVIIIIALLLIAASGVAFWLGLDFFKYRGGPIEGNESYIGGEFQGGNTGQKVYDTQILPYIGPILESSPLTPANKKTTIHSKLKGVNNGWDVDFAKIQATPGSGYIPKNDHNPIHDSTLIFFGSSACSVCRDMHDIPYGSWNKVQKNPILYNYYKNLGPTNEYAKDAKSENLSQYWQVQKWKATNGKEAYLQPLVTGTSESTTLNTNSVVSYDDNHYKLGQKEGLPGVDNNVSELISGALKNGNHPSFGDYEHDPYIMKVDLSTSYKKYVPDTSGPTYPNDYLDHLNNSFSVDSPPEKTDPTDIVAFPFFGIIHDTYAYAPKGSTDPKKAPKVRKLFFTEGALNYNQLQDFINWVYTGYPKDDSGKILINPFWDKNANLY